MADEKEQQGEQGYQLQSQHFYKIITSYMPESFEQDAVQIALIAVDKYRQLKDIAFYIKHEYDKKYPGSGKATEGVYHCIVGKSFASKCGTRAGTRGWVLGRGLAVFCPAPLCLCRSQPTRMHVYVMLCRCCEPRNAAIHPHEGTPCRGRARWMKGEQGRSPSLQHCLRASDNGIS